MKEEKDLEHRKAAKNRYKRYVTMCIMCAILHTSYIMPYAIRDLLLSPIHLKYQVRRLFSLIIHKLTHFVLLMYLCITHDNMQYAHRLKERGLVGESVDGPIGGPGSGSGSGSGSKPVDTAQEDREIARVTRTLVAARYQPPDKQHAIKIQLLNLKAAKTRRERGEVEVKSPRGDNSNNVDDNNNNEQQTKLSPRPRPSSGGPRPSSGGGGAQRNSMADRDRDSDFVRKSTENNLRRSADKDRSNQQQNRPGSAGIRSPRYQEDQYTSPRNNNANNNGNKGNVQNSPERTRAPASRPAPSRTFNNTAPGSPGQRQPLPETFRNQVQVSLEEGVMELRSYRGYYSILVMSYFMWSGALDSSTLLLSCFITSLASHITIILISTLKHTHLNTLYPCPSVRNAERKRPYEPVSCQLL